MQTRSQKIVECLPELRRYAHALFGSRQSGDGRLRMMLEALLQNPGELGTRELEGADLRRALFRFFHTVSHALQSPIELEAAADGDMPERRLRDAVAGLPLRNREALLLTSLGGFDLAQVSEILGIAPLGVERALAEARERIRTHLSARVLIVDDRARAGAKLERVVEALGHAVVGVVPSDNEAVDVARERQPEIVVADLHGQGGVEAEAHLQSAVAAPVVSLRKAHPRRANGRRAAARSSARRRVTAHDIGDAISDALAAPAGIKANILRG